MADSGVEHSTGSCAFAPADRSERECRSGGSTVERRDEFHVTERVSGAGRILMGRELLGGWLLCRKCGHGSGRYHSEIHSRAAEGPEHAAALKPWALARGVGSLSSRMFTSNL